MKRPIKSRRADVVAAPVSSRRRWLFRIGALLLLPLLLGGLELALRLGGYGYNPDFFLPQRIGTEDFLVQNEEFSRRFFPAEVSRQPGALRMRARKVEDSIRIFVLGESAAMGDPEPAFGPARYLEALLCERYPQARFEIINVAYTAINSHVILPIARECAQRDGDVWIVYIGNNEMVGPFGAATVFGPPAPALASVRLSLALQRTRVGQLGRAWADALKRPATDAPSWQGMQMFLENRVLPDASTRAATHENFAANLEDIVTTGLASGARVLLNTVAVNLRESPPFASLTGEQRPAEHRMNFESLLERARRAETNSSWSDAAKLLAEALELEPAYAEAHFRRAMCLERMGETNAAQQHYQLACDTDALPFRADSRSNQAIRNVAQRHAGATLRLVEAPVALADAAGTPACGNESFYEHVHFNFAGAYRLGLIWARAVAEVLPPEKLGTAATDWATQETCEQFLALTDWNRKLVLESVLRRLQQPPLSSQFNNAARLQQLQDQERALFTRLTTKAVGAARETFAAALARRPDDHYLHELHGNFLQLTGDLPGAVQAWRRAGELMPHDFLPWFQLGNLLARQGNHSAAQENFHRALRVRPGLIEGWMELARSLMAERQWSPALAALQQARQLRPQDPAIWANEARVLRELGRTAEAESAHQRALALQSKFTAGQPQKSQ